MGSGEAKSFSMHEKAEEKNIEFSDIDKYYDELEKSILDSYFNFLLLNCNCTFLHWNMNKSSFGFSAIEHRYKVLQGEPYVIQENKKISLSREFVNIYGESYIEDPRLISLTKENNISLQDFLEGKDEALAFDNKEYTKIQRSTLKKVDILNTFFDKACSNNLKTKERFFRDRCQGNILYCLDIVLESFWGRFFVALCSVLGLFYSFFS